MKVAGGAKVGGGDLVWATGEARSWAHRGYSAFIKASDSNKSVEIRRSPTGGLAVIPSAPAPDWLRQVETIIHSGEERSA